MPRVSVLMVARNTEAYINQAVTSLIQQTFADWELIAIDDGSNDGTLEQLESWRRQDRRIRVHRHLINQGLGIVRRQSLELAFGDYAAVLDSDDVAEPDWLARRVAVLDSRPSIVAISGARVLIDEQGRRIGFHVESDPPEVVRWRLLFGNPVSNPSSAFRIQAAKDSGGYDRVCSEEDWSLFQRLARCGGILLESEAAVRYRIRQSSHSRGRIDKRQSIESLVAGYISEQCEHELGIPCPAELAWYLFRERHPFPGLNSLADAGVEFVLNAASLFVRRHESVRSSSRLAGAVIADVANVRRCAPHGIAQFASDARRIWDVMQPEKFDPAFVTALAKLAFAPVRAYQARTLARQQRFANP